MSQQHDNNPDFHPQPTPKSKGINDLIGAIMGKGREATILAKGCMTCDTLPIPTFRDPLSLREYEISGMCQACQDSIYGSEEDEGFNEGL